MARYQRRQAALRARLTADLVDALDAADDQALVQVALRDARDAGAADPIGVAAAALTTLAVLATTTRVAPGG